MKKIINVILLITTLTLFTVTNVFAYYSSKIVVTPPPWGGSVDVINSNGQVTKTSTSKSVTFYGIQETSTLDPYGRLINSQGETRSDWVAIKQGEYQTSQSNTGIINYYLYSRIKSNNLEWNEKTIAYQFNPY